MERIAHFIFRLPLFCRLSRKTIFAGQMFIGDALTSYRGRDLVESAKVIIFAIVETETLLIDVTEKMERFNADIGSANGALEQAPKVFDSVGMHVALNIAFHVIDDLMDVFFIESGIRGKLIGKQHAIRLYCFPDLSFNR